MQNFNIDLLKSDWCEAALAMKLRISYSVQRMNHELFPYDIVFGSALDFDKHWRLELKSLNWKQAQYPSGVLEVYKDDLKHHRPQWYEYNNSIDFVALQNISDFVVHMFDAQKLKSHFIDLEKRHTHMYSAHASSSNRNACPGYVYKVAWQDTTAGYTGTSIDITSSMYHYALMNPEIQHAFPDIFKSVKEKYNTTLKVRYQDKADEHHNKLVKLYA
tara:strand:+ start:82 stop:732 length:651 start_codon:yes stop_codon:yes gene_type:complete